MQEGESLKEAAVRELKEEAGIVALPRDLEKVAIIEFFFEDGRHLEVHIFFVRTWEGTITSSKEMHDPQWFSFDSIPYDAMWEDDIHWMPKALKGERLYGKVWFDQSNAHIKKMEWSAQN